MEKDFITDDDDDVYCLVPYAEQDRADFERLLDVGYSCVCWQGHPPCMLCEHPGNPENQINDDRCWTIYYTQDELLRMFEDYDAKQKLIKVKREREKYLANHRRRGMDLSW